MSNKPPRGELRENSPERRLVIACPLSVLKFEVHLLGCFGWVPSKTLKRLPCAGFNSALD